MVTITNSFATGNVNGSGYCRWFAGIPANGGNIINSFAKGNVNGNNSIGGFAGLQQGVINSSYSMGNVNGNNNIGGFVGNVSGGNISNSYSVGIVNPIVTSGNFGGFAGTQTGGIITMCFWDITVNSGISGITAGNGVTNMQAMNLSTVAMQSASASGVIMRLGSAFQYPGNNMYPLLYYRGTMILASRTIIEVFAKSIIAFVWLWYMLNIHTPVRYQRTQLKRQSFKLFLQPNFK